VKQCVGFPELAAAWCLADDGLEPGDLDHIRRLARPEGEQRPPRRWRTAGPSSRARSEAYWISSWTVRTGLLVPSRDAAVRAAPAPGGFSRGTRSRMQRSPPTARPSDEGDVLRARGR
jgi:hypothetical protein